MSLRLVYGVFSAATTQEKQDIRRNLCNLPFFRTGCPLRLSFLTGQRADFAVFSDKFTMQGESPPSCQLPAFCRSLTHRKRRPGDVWIAVSGLASDTQEGPPVKTGSPSVDWIPAPCSSSRSWLTRSASVSPQPKAATLHSSGSSTFPPGGACNIRQWGFPSEG